jgi:hypothetical protein
MSEVERCKLRLKELKAESDSIRVRLSEFYGKLEDDEITNPKTVITSLQGFIDDFIDHTIHCHEFYDNELSKLCCG